VNEGSQSCELCAAAGGEVLWESPVCRVIRVDDANYPGFCRVIWTAHVREMTDLEPAQQQYLMSIVFAVERVIRQLFTPDKINLASFGNMVPHLHWHIIPRWENDRHFPEPIWGMVRQENKIKRHAVGNIELARALSETLSYPDDLSGRSHHE
jgi:diadenosine tetraphosphate (Ap4A) HIT family hydrolase